MLIAKMDTIIIFTDNSGLIPETYAIETNEPIDKITVTLTKTYIKANKVYKKYYKV